MNQEQNDKTKVKHIDMKEESQNYKVSTQPLSISQMTK